MRLLSWLKKEFIRMLPVALFFLVAFLLVDATDRAINHHEYTYYSFFYCVIASLIMGKVVLIADQFAVIELYSTKPLVYATLWKSFFYVFCSILLRLVEHAIPALWHGESWAMIGASIQEHIERPLFWVAQGWLAYLFIIYVGGRELITAIGPKKVWKLFFG